MGKKDSSFKITVVISTFLTMTESLLTNNNLKKRIPPFSKVVGRFYFFQHIRTYCIENWQQGPISAQSAFFSDQLMLHSSHPECRSRPAGSRVHEMQALGCPWLHVLGHLIGLQAQQTDALGSDASRRNQGAN